MGLDLEKRKKYLHEYRKNNLEKYNQWVYLARERNRKIADKIKLTKGCNICGYRKNARALCFHHLDLSTKNGSVRSLYSHSKNKMLEEIDKCIVLCANCHLELHEKEEKMS